MIEKEFDLLGYHAEIGSSQNVSNKYRYMIFINDKVVDLSNYVYLNVDMASKDAAKSIFKFVGSVTVKIRS